MLNGSVNVFKCSYFGNFINKLHQDPIIDIEEDHAPGGWGAPYNDL